MNDPNREYRTVEAFKKFPFLVHGFGTRFWKEEDFESTPELAGFHHVSLIQTHSDIVRVISDPPRVRMKGDALVTNRPGVLLIIKTADCLPALIVDVQDKVVAAVHCGWRGTLKKVLVKTLRAMQRNYNSDFASLSVALGPCIEKFCYEVGEDVREEFEREGLPKGIFARHPSKKDRYLLDLKAVNRAQLLDLGVLDENIFSVEICTHCAEDLFSYRREKKHAGRLINFIGIY